MKQPGLYVIHARALRDAAGTRTGPASILVYNGRVHQTGNPATFDPKLLQRAEAIDQRNSLVLPAMVNAHTHLELTAIGPQPYDPAQGFVGWVKMLRSHWPSDPDPGKLPAAQWFVQAARLGARQTQQAGVQAVGDISRLSEVADERRTANLGGVTYLELFGLGPPFDAPALRQIVAANFDGLQPHAPYSAGETIYQAAAQSGKPVSTHLAETHDEAAFVSQLAGPKLDFIQSINRWDRQFAEQYGRGLSPTQWVRPHLEAAADQGGWLVAHCNYVSNQDITILAETNTSVAYCPIASEYFGHQYHRYRDMLDAGINVCLGTDSIVCADADDPQPLGLLSAMRRLYQRDRTDPDMLLAMATVNGARALRLTEGFATFQRDTSAQFACIAIDPDDPTDPLVQALTSQVPVEAISLGTPFS